MKTQLRHILLILGYTLGIVISAMANTFTVIQNGDTGAGSLREAITSANSVSGIDTILFNIPGPTATIMLDSSLATITETLIIDGSSQPSFSGSNPVIFIDGSAAPNSSGLIFYGAAAIGSVLKSVGISNMTRNGIEIIQASDVSIKDCWVGISPDGYTPAGSGEVGILANNSAGLAIERCVVVESSSQGILMRQNCTGFLLQENYVGVSPSEVNAMGNNFHGIHLMQNCNSGMIAGNVLSGNQGSGLQLEQDCDDVQILTNIIGLDPKGKVALPNTGAGIEVGIQCDRIRIGQPGKGNVISGNDFDGIYIHNASTNDTIQGNLIGLSKSGRMPFGNGKNGIALQADVTNCLIGGTNDQANYIADNAINGIGLIEANNNQILGNYIGMDIYGVKPLGNGEDGINLFVSDFNTIGAPFEYKNYIGNNARDGITIEEYSDNNIVQGNWIGLAPDGSTNFGNGSILGSCLDIKRANAITVGGCNAGEGNVMVNSITSGAGIYTEHITNCSILGNFIGTDTTKTLVAGNTFRGISMYGTSTNNHWGTGSSAACGNTIVHNLSDAIYIDVNTVQGTQMRNNQFFGNQGIGINLNGAGNTNREGPTILNLSNCFIDGTGQHKVDTVDLYYDYGYNNNQGAVKFATVIPDDHYWSYSGPIEGGSRIVAMGTNPEGNSSPFWNFAGQNLTDAGRDSTVYLCVSETAYDLTQGLAGIVDGGGSWSDDDLTGALSGSSFNAAIAGEGTFHFTYSVNITGGCGGTDQATVTVKVGGAETAGQGKSFTLCADGPYINLLDSLTGNSTAIGSWIDNDSAFIARHIFIPVDLAGDYEVSFVPQSNGCITDTAIFNITVYTSPDAGRDTNSAVCGGDTLFDLAELVYSNALSSHYVDADGAGNLVGSMIRPSLIDPGTYRYFFVATSPNECSTDTAIITITIDAHQSAGENSTVGLCTIAENFVLLDSLHGNPDEGGTWTLISGAGVTNNGVFDLSASGLGTSVFQYNFSAIGACPADSSRLTVTLDQLPIAGPDFDTAVCFGTTGFNLDTVLLTEIGSGIWSDAENTGYLTGADLNLASVTVGIYRFDYVVSTTFCPADTAAYEIQIQSSLNAGRDSVIAHCNADSPLDLRAFLSGNDATNLWLDGNLNSIDPIVDVSAIQGVLSYYHVIDTSEGCSGDTAELVLQLSDFETTVHSHFQSICLGGAVNLNELLQHHARDVGVWTTLTGDTIFQSTVTTDTILGAEFRAIHLADVGSCVGKRDTLILAVRSVFEQINDTSLMLCGGPTSLSLDSTMGFQGGNWFDSSNTAISSEVVLPNQVLDVAVFHVNDNEYNCPADTIQVTFEIRQEVPTSSDTNVTLLFDGPPVELTTLYAATNDRINWIDSLNSGGLAGSIFNTQLVPDGNEYMIQRVLVNGCGADTGRVSIYVSLNCGLSAFQDSQSVCLADSTVQLSQYLTAEISAQGRWYDPLKDQLLDSDTLHLVPNEPSKSLLFITDSVNECASDTLFFKLNFIARPTAGNSLDSAVCLDGTLFDLNSLLSPKAEPGGIWYAANPSLNPIDDTIQFNWPAGTREFWYVISNDCEADSAIFTLTGQPIPTVELSQNTTINRGTGSILRAEANGAIVAGWLPSSTLSDTANFNPVVSPEISTTYYFTAVAENGCKVTDSVLVQVISTVEVPQAFTPDNDGVNDFWEVRNLDLYPKSSVRIFDRWGHLLIEFGGDSAGWDGNFNGNPAPIGAYIYLIDFGNSTPPLTGTLNLVR